MPRLIDADALIQDAEPELTWGMLGKINEAQTVDAVPVVRCKDCKYWQDNNGGYPNTECRWGHEETPDEDDFCSYGERKDDAHEPMGT